MSHQTTTTVHPTKPFKLDSSLSLIPRLRLNLTIHRADKSVSPLDEWKLKNSLIDYLTKTHSITLSEQHIKLHKFKDLKKRKREEPVAKGSLFILDFEPFLVGIKNLGLEGDELEKRLLEWKKGIFKGMDGMELNLEGVRFKLSVVLPVEDDVVGMKKQWEEFEAFGNNKGYSRGERKQHDTIILRALPSRWFAETRVSSKPSMLVSHTIFSALGNIRNLDVAEDNDIDDEVEDGGGLVSGLNCKIVVRFKTHADFFNALKLLCGRSLMKEGSRLRADYEVTWDKDGFFQSSRSQVEERKKWAPSTREGNYRNEPYSRALNSDNSRRRRFKD